MNGRRISNQGIGAVRGMFMFALLAAFALLSVMVVLVGARVYRAVESRGSENYETRTVLAYIAGKVRALDAEDRIEAVSVGDAQALMLGADYGGKAYATYIYVWDGRLMEYFGRAEREFSPAYGDEIAEAAAFSVTLEGRLLTLSVTRPDGGAETLRLYLQSGEAGA